MTQHLSSAEWQPIETAPRDGLFFGAFFTVSGDMFARPVVVDCRERDWPRRIEFYDGKQRVFPTHYLPLPTPPAGEQA